MVEQEFPLTHKVREDLDKLVVLIRSSKGSGAPILLGFSGPVAQEAVKKELKQRLIDQFKFETIQWNPKIRGIEELFPKEDTGPTIYFVEGLEKNLQGSQEEVDAAYALLNFTREYYTKSKKTVLYCLPSDLIYKGIQWKAGDFWSFRAGTYDFFFEEDYTAEIREKISSELENYETPSDQIALYEEFLATERKKKNPDSIRVADLLVTLVDLYRKIGEPQKALPYSQEALEIARKLGDRPYEAYALNTIGSSYLELSQIHEALNYIQEAREKYRQLGDQKGESAALNNTASIYIALRQPEKALQFLQDAFDMANKVGYEDLLCTAKIGIARIYFANLGDYQKGLSLLEEAMETAQSFGYKDMISQILEDYGVIYIKQGHLQKALEFLLKSVEYSRQLKNKDAEAHTLWGIGTVYMKMGENQRALSQLQNARELYQQIGNKLKEEEISKLIEEIKSSE